ncbi:glycerol-3-phosphate acyltransferase 1 [Oceanobacillus arenosus]|uniref:Glycerol-3-phosphate acyltransferase n=1 Tax=Oceanobacillus arenosus TaxID=1229153 RepID=A0A3D8Q171_9BACI|nr:glycerol-3-phosphate acyltransferase [Oceanobacillus arenosus]RDW21348.1 glycerol-3-phosphate acyltransferase 1 [Oceanobacillus arenosus]
MFFISIMLIGYLLGCINGAQIIGKYKQFNIKSSGSKNAGATNTFILLGWKSGVLVAFIDVFKAIISLVITASLLVYADIHFDLQVLLLYVNALFVLLGHIYPVTLHFNGGKGTASFLGFLLFLNWKFAIMAFIIFLCISFVTNYFVFGTFSAYLSFIIYTIFYYGRGPVYIAVLLTMFFIANHIDNFKRIINKEETKLSKR